MKTCKYCGTILDGKPQYCPACQKPVLAPGQTLQDFTKKYNPLEENYELVNLKSRWIVVVLALLLGSLGAPYLYLGWYKKALFFLLWPLALTLFLAVVPNLWIWAVAAVMGIHISLAVQFGLRAELKDARGEFLK